MVIQLGQYNKKKRERERKIEKERKGNQKERNSSENREILLSVCILVVLYHFLLVEFVYLSGFNRVERFYIYIRYTAGLIQMKTICEDSENKKENKTRTR